MPVRSDGDPNVMAPKDYFRVVGRRGDSHWIIGDRSSLGLAECLAHDERCVGVDIEIYDDMGEIKGRV